MNREEAIKVIVENCYFNSLVPGAEEALATAIKTLKQEPCEDCVSRQAVKDIIHKYKNDSECLISWVMDSICDLPSVTPTQRWIPTSERQPEANGNYLAFYRSSDGTATLEFMMVDHCNADGDWLHEESGRKSYRKVIAWMPLPEPYKAEMESEE